MRYRKRYRILYYEFLFQKCNIVTQITPTISYLPYLRYRIHPTYDIVFDIVCLDLRYRIRYHRTYDIVGFYLRYRRFLWLFLPLAPTMSYTMSYTTSYVTTYDIVYDMIKIYDIVGFDLQYRRFLDCSCQSYVRCDVRRRKRYCRFPTMSYTICMSHIGIIRCRTSNTMS